MPAPTPTPSPSPIRTDHWQRALALMSSAVTLRADERDAWLARVTGEEPDVAPLLNKLMNARRRVETNDVLATLPRLQRSGDAARGLSSAASGSIGAHIGPFELIELLGLGGMGSVWRARYSDGRLKRDVAVKLPATSDNPASLAALRERFARERDFLAQLEHPNIARLYDTGVTEEGQPFLAMEYVAGVPIDAYCDDHKLSIKARLTLYLQVLAAVEFAHRQLVLHRDLKPGNVLVDASGQVRLLDFGVAKLLPQQAEGAASATTATASSAGTDLTEMAGAAITLAYAAPEQINNGRLSTATDVYALGVMLYRLLTGSTPYQPARDTRGALEEAVLVGAPIAPGDASITSGQATARATTPDKLRKSLRGDIGIIILKALKKNSDERYPAVAAFAEDLSRHLERQPINARADSLWYRSNRFIARHRIAVAASAIGICALLATTGIAVWQAKVATANAARATKESARLATAQKFLAGIFANADPEQNKGASVTAREILDRGRDTAERELANDPEALALVLAQIGDIYFRLGLPDQYLGIQRKRVAVLEAQRDADVNALVDAKLALGQALGGSNVPEQSSQAMATLTSAHEIAKTYAASSDRVVWALCLIADQHRGERKLAQARAVATEAVSLGERTLPNPHPVLAASYHADAMVARDQGRMEDARQSFKRALAIDESPNGRSKVDQAMTRGSFAQLEYDASDYLAASREALAVIEFARVHLGEIEFNLAPARRIVVFATERAGDLALARRFSDELLAPEIASTQPMRVATARLARARVAMSSGNLAAAAEELALAAPTLSKGVLWPGRIAAVQAELNLRAGDPAATVTLLEPILERQLKLFGSESTELAVSYEWLGVAHARLGHTEVAQTHFDKSCALRKLYRAINHPQRVRCEAYQVMLDIGLSESAKIDALRSLETTIRQGRLDHIALIPALQRTRLSLESTLPAQRDARAFPILD